ncbi:MAG: phenylalanine--tRNA ligase subunit beta [Planctomycetaceae bacterium]|nr:phenylalanine--tRNA ligase subunit beta [Planctomycetaceae bacterium]
MIVSLDWLSEYVDLPEVDVLTEQLLLSGLNHESTKNVGSDTVIDLEVTSNRPDCLGHIGVAREVSVLFQRPLKIPRASITDPAASHPFSVAIDATDMCPFYTARLIRGVTVGPSPDWLVRRLEAVGVASVNNVVDITNYVMLECGQPLHAFDLSSLRGDNINVRRARQGESFVAINHKEYELTSEMCVISDSKQPVAIAGVMGGAETEISTETTDVLIESAQFAPLPVRSAARALVLGSPSSYRFERGPDPAAVEWASCRAVELILDLAGGTFAAPAFQAGSLDSSQATIDLRRHRVEQVLGVSIPKQRQREILQSLGFVEQEPGGDVTRWLAPTWRRDCTREIDLVEEVARVEGYDCVPENIPITAVPVQRSPRERMVRIVSESCVAAGFCEAMTRSVVGEKFEELSSPWGCTPALVCSPPLVQGADRLRRTLLPSLLDARSNSLSSGSSHGDLFEIAHCYLSRENDVLEDASPIEEPLLLALVTGGDFFHGKGFATAIFERLGLYEWSSAEKPIAHTDVEFGLTYHPFESAVLQAGRSAEILFHRSGEKCRRIGVVGEFSADVMKMCGLDRDSVGIELRLDGLEFTTMYEPTLLSLSSFPSIDRDMNLVVDEAISWASICAAIESTQCDALESIRLGQIWRDAERLGKGTKSVVVSIRLRSFKETLSAEQANAFVDAMVNSCQDHVGAALRG